MFGLPSGLADARGRGPDFSIVALTTHSPAPPRPDTKSPQSLGVGESGRTRRGQRVRDPPACPPTHLRLPESYHPRLPPVPVQDKSDKGRTLGCAGCELGVKVKGVIRLGDGRLEGWLDLTTVQLLKSGVGIPVTITPPQPAGSPMQEMIGPEHRLCSQGHNCLPLEG